MLHVQGGYRMTTIPFMKKMSDVSFSAICFLCLCLSIFPYKASILNLSEWQDK